MKTISFQRQSVSTGGPKLTTAQPKTHYMHKAMRSLGKGCCHFGAATFLIGTLRLPTSQCYSITVVHSPLACPGAAAEELMSELNSSFLCEFFLGVNLLSFIIKHRGGETEHDGIGDDERHGE